MGQVTIADDPFVFGLQLARRSQLVELASRVGLQVEFVVRWRGNNSGDLAPWLLREAAEVLELDEQELLEHRREQQRRDEREAEFRRESALARWATDARS